ncbi:MAG: hypothetical protein QM724_02525 [Flavobacteriales bacterium]
MKSLYSAALIALSGTLLFSACKKEKDTETPSTPSNSSNQNAQARTTPNFRGANASLWAVNTFTTQTTPIGPIDIQAGIGVAMFSNDTYTGFTSAGSVKLNDKSLTEQTDHSYLTIPSMAEPTGVDLSSGQTRWVVTGAGANPAFDRTPSITFPTVQGINSSTTVVRANGYTLTTPSVSGADSVIFAVGGLLKTKGPGTTSCTFTASELGALSAGSSIVQVAAYTYTHEVISGKDIYFGKEAVQTRSVTIQ